MSSASRTLQQILYVEDDPDIQVVAKIALEMVGEFTLSAHSSGVTALKAVEDGFVPDLMLLDVMMPEMDGPTTLSKLREMTVTATTPVVFMTAKVQASEVAYYKSLGAVGVIPKPFDPMTLSNQLRELWESTL
jgi:two-component system, OmpR family, response regulator